MTALVVSLAALSFGSRSVAEEKPCRSSSGCELSLKDKVAQSVGSAEFIVRGTFRIDPSGAPEKLSDDVSFVPVTFQVNATLKGAPLQSPLSLKLPAYTPRALPSLAGKCAFCCPVGANPARLAHLADQLTHLERESERGQLLRKDRKAIAQTIRGLILTTVGYTPDQLLLVDVAPGGLDSRYRDATVAIWPGREYLLVGFKQPQSQGATALFRNEFDVYSMSGDDASQLSAVRSALRLPSN